MPIFAGSGWRKFGSQDTAIPQVTNLLRAQVENNRLDCEQNPALQVELYARCQAALKGATEGVNGGLGALPGFTNGGKPVEPFHYEEEPTDEWKTFRMLAEEVPGRTIRLDCDCISPVWAAFFWFRWKGAVPVGVGISQPKVRPCRCKAAGSRCQGIRCTPEGPICESCGYGMAHAYTILRADPFTKARANRLGVGLEGIPREALDLLRQQLIPMGGKYRGTMVLDGSVLAGMPKPRDDFYGSGETALKWLRNPDDEDS